MQLAEVLWAMLAGATMGAAAPYLSARMVAQRLGEYVSPTSPRLAASIAVGSAAAASITASRGPSAETAELVCLVAPLLTAALADLDAWLIPRECVRAVLAVRLVYIVATFVTAGAPAAWALLRASLLGALAMGLPLLAVTLFMERTQPDADSLGGGDVRLLVAVGAIFGWLGAALALTLSCLFGIVHYYACYQRKGEGRTFPFAPSIALACWAVTLCQPLLADLAVRLFA